MSEIDEVSLTEKNEFCSAHCAGTEITQALTKTLVKKKKERKGNVSLSGCVECVGGVCLTGLVPASYTSDVLTSRRIW